MSAPAVISGDFATYKHVQGRKIMQLEIEVPAEMASAVFAALGTPGSGEGIPVALARLVDDARVRPEHVEPIAKPEAAKERRAFTDLPYATQSGIRCNEPDFQAYLTEFKGLGKIETPEQAAEAVRVLCHVESRSELQRGTDAGDWWESLEGGFYAWSRGMR